MIEKEINGRTTVYRGDNKELFENFKKELIEQINALKIEDDPHAMLIVAKGHDTPKFMTCACPGSLMEWGIELLTNVSQRSAEHRRAEMPTMMAKGGIA